MNTGVKYNNNKPELCEQYCNVMYMYVKLKEKNMLKHSMLYWNRDKLIIGTTNEVNVLILD